MQRLVSFIPSCPDYAQRTLLAVRETATEGSDQPAMGGGSVMAPPGATVPQETEADLGALLASLESALSLFSSTTVEGPEALEWCAAELAHAWKMYTTGATSLELAEVAQHVLARMDAARLSPPTMVVRTTIAPLRLLIARTLEGTPVRSVVEPESAVPSNAAFVAAVEQLRGRAAAFDDLGTPELRGLATSYREVADWVEAESVRLSAPDAGVPS